MTVTKKAVDRALEEAELGCVVNKVYFKQRASDSTAGAWMVMTHAGSVIGVCARSLNDYTTRQWVLLTQEALLGKSLAGEVSSTELLSCRSWAPKDLLPAVKDRKVISTVQKLMLRRKRLYKDLEDLDVEIMTNLDKVYNIWEAKVAEKTM